MALTPKTRIEHFLARIAGDPATILTPITRIEMFLQRIIDVLSGGGGGGEVTPASIVTATGQMDAMQKGQTRANLNAVAATNPEVRGSIGITGYGDTHDQIYAELDDPAAGRPPVLVLGDSESDNPIIVRGIDDPISATDAANKNYVDLLKPVVTTVSGSTPTIAAEDNHIYECGELTSLTVTAFDNPGSFILRFISGATATTTTLPAGMVFPEAFAPEANTRYEINCVDGYALAVGWPYTPPAVEE